MKAPLSNQDLLALKEDVDFEAKLAQGRDGDGEVPKDFWVTYSAMANTYGGRILLGAEEHADGSLRVRGIAKPRRVVKALWDTLNNRQKISHNLLQDEDVEVREVEGTAHPIILISVPQATRRQRPVHVGENPLRGTYRRNFEGDYHCDEATVRRMLAEALQDTRDAHLLPGFSLDDLDPDTISAYRNLFRASKPNHLWLALDDRELLRRLGGWVRDRESGREGLTLAGLLMFGQLHAIREEVPTYILDYQEKFSLDPKIRWDHRITTDGAWSGNLLDFYRLVYPRLTADLRVPFRLEAGHQRVDETEVHEALREALVNTLIHADYRQSVGIRVYKYPDRFEFWNPGRLRIPRALALQGGTSDCRNRNLQKMFQMIGAGEQAGSGVPRIMEAWREQHWRAPILEEQLDPEQTTLRLSMVSLISPEVIEELDARFGEGFRSLSETERLAVATALSEGRVTNERLREISGEHPSDLTMLLRKLVDGKFLVRPERGRSYQLPPIEETVPAPGEVTEPGHPVTREISPELLSQLNPRQVRAVEWVLEKGSITRSEYAAQFGGAQRTANRDLRELVDRQIFESRGEGPGTHYVLRASA